MRHPKDMSRRQFLTRAGGAAIAMPSLAAILAACSKPGTASASGGAARSRSPRSRTRSSSRSPRTRSRPTRRSNRVRWSSTTGPTTSARRSSAEFEDKFGVTVDITTFNNMEEGIQKVVNGQVTPDVFVPTPGYLRRLVQKDLLQPLQHELIPNMEANVWPSYSNPGPYYDLGWNYTVPYTIYTWGVAYRRDRVSDDEAAAQGWNALWNHDYDGRDQPVRLLRRHDRDHDPAQRQPRREHGRSRADRAAKEAILQTINDNEARLTINGVYAKLPAGDFTVAESWSGDIVGAQCYLPNGTGTDVLGYWRPEDGKTMIGNDLLAIPTSSKNPRLAHEFINFMLDEKHGTDNFVQLERLPAAVHLDRPEHA